MRATDGRGAELLPPIDRSKCARGTGVQRSRSSQHSEEAALRRDSMQARPAFGLVVLVTAAAEEALDVGDQLVALGQP